ncbi:hypothetical protein KI688_007031 [Linnemannia hyalina]|uniref:Homeobox domain-containing protein n=1 Tax=Linnemannia hyalina TaxID=64524 RepID=A0A9P7XIF0_9FUNG|nr:hypothetical protein KI688_007031 [Linnemannia hyalina]
MHPIQLALPFTSHSHDIPTSLSTNSSPTRTEALNNLFLVDQSEDFQRTAELLDIGLSSYIDGPSLPPPALMFDTTMCDTIGLATIAQQQQQQQIGDLEPDPHGSGGAGSQQPSTPGWGLVETAGFLLDDVHSSSASSSRVSFSSDDPWIEQFLQQQLPPLPPPIISAEIRQQQPRQEHHHQKHQVSQEQWFLLQQQQQQFNQTTVSTPDYVQSQHSTWPWFPFDHQQQISSPQHSLHLEYPFANPHHTPHTIPTDYLQHQIPSPSSSSPSFQHHQYVTPPYETFEHQCNQKHQQQQPHPPQQQHHHLRRNSNNHRHPQHHHHYQHLFHHHEIPVIQSLKRRRRLTTEESEYLMVQFNLNGRPTAQERDCFARHLKLNRRTIQVWFQNRRAKLKRDERGVCGQNGSAGGSGGGRGDDDDDEGEEDGDFDDGTGGVQEASKDTNVGRELGYQQQTIHQQNTGGDGLFQLLPQQQQQLYPLLPPPSLDILDLDGEGNGEGDDLGLDFFHIWNTNNEANYITGSSNNGSNSNTISRGEMMTGMGMGLAQAARLEMELFSGQHSQYYQLQQQQQQLRMAQVAAEDHDPPHPLQRWVDGASFRDCLP